MKNIILGSFIILSSVFSIEKTSDYYQELSDNIRLYFDVMLTLNENYVDTANIEELMSEGIRAMLSKTDPYTVLLKDNEIDHYDELSTGKYGGIGIYLGTSGQDKRLTVISPMDDTPASKVGLRAGDRIMFIEDMDTFGMSVKDASKYLKGEPGTRLKLKVKRSGSDKILDFNLTRASIEIANIPYSEIIDENIGYIKINEFSGTLYYDFMSEFEKLISKGATSLIIDLRYNPGGLLETAVKLSGAFLPKGKPVVSTRSRDAESEIMYNTYLEPADTEIPVVVMINGSSASASEIFAGALQDHDRAVIVGEGSFGKGLVQQLFDVGYYQKKNLKMTIRKYYTPTGRLIQKDDIFGDRKKNGSDTVFYNSLVNGRPLPSGIGILPDIPVEPAKNKGYISYLRMNNFFSDFVYEFYNRNGNYEYDGAMNDDIISDFREFLSDSKSLYTDPGEMLVDSLLKISGELGYDELSVSKIMDIKAHIHEMSSNNFDDNIEDIKHNLLIEFGVYTNGNREKYRIMNTSDPQLQKAVSVLKNIDTYNSVLGY
ncbi:MAG: S41 family peptidase [Candidatus Delongbacteria bacterium]|nr:S41 family peptidase [Candidatus Delongbacteria bacterium]